MQKVLSQSAERYCEGSEDSKLGYSNKCLVVQPEQVLARLSRAKATSNDARLIIVDMRESRLYQAGHLLTSYSANCYTKTMTKRAIIWWDNTFAKERKCPAPITRNSPTFGIQISQFEPSVVVYDHRGTCPPMISTHNNQVPPAIYFIHALLSRGNRVFLMSGGYEGFQRLHNSAEFIDHGSPFLINIYNPDYISSSEAQSPVSVSDLSEYSILGAVNCSLNTNSDVDSPGLSKPNPYRGCIELTTLTGSSRETDQTGAISVAPHDYSCDAESVKEAVDPDERPNVETMMVRVSRTPVGAMYLREDMDDVFTASVSKILSYLYLGNARDSQDVDLLRRLQITHIVNVTDSAPIVTKAMQHVKYLHLPATDTIQQDLRPAFDCAVQFIENARRSNGVVLVHCLAGVSRSVAVVMAYLLYRNRNFTVLKALEYIQNRRPVAGPNLHFMGQLQCYYRDLICSNSKPVSRHNSSTSLHESHSSHRRGSGDSLVTENQYTKALPRSGSFSNQTKRSHRSVSRKNSVGTSKPHAPFPLPLLNLSESDRPPRFKVLHSTWSASTNNIGPRRPLLRNGSHESKGAVYGNRLMKT